MKSLTDHSGYNHTTIPFFREYLKSSIRDFTKKVVLLVFILNRN